MFSQVIQCGFCLVFRENSARFLVIPFCWSFNCDLEGDTRLAKLRKLYSLCVGHDPRVDCDNIIHTTDTCSYINLNHVPFIR